MAHLNFHRNNGMVFAVKYAATSGSNFNVGNGFKTTYQCSSQKQSKPGKKSDDGSYQAHPCG